MEASHLKLKSEDCSAIGLLILDYMKQHQLDFTEMADKIGVSRAVLRIACLKQGSPCKRLISKLAKVLDRAEKELLRLDAQNQLEMIYERNNNDKT